MTDTSVASSTMSPKQGVWRPFWSISSFKIWPSVRKISLTESSDLSWKCLSRSIPESLLQTWPTAEIFCFLYAPLRGSMQLQNTFPAHLLIPPFVQLYPCGSWTSAATSPAWYLVCVAQSVELSMRRTSFSNSVFEWNRVHPWFEPFSQHAFCKWGNACHLLPCRATRDKVKTQEKHQTRFIISGCQHSRLTHVDEGGR